MYFISEILCQRWGKVWPHPQVLIICSLPGFLFSSVNEEGKYHMLALTSWPFLQYLTFFPKSADWYWGATLTENQPKYVQGAALATHAQSAIFG